MAQKVYVEPIVYKIGESISQEAYDEAIQKITDWFAQSRATKEPAATARKAFAECLEGVKSDGTKWFEMALSSLEARVRSKCRFDIQTMKPLLNASDKQRKKKEREADQRKKKRADAAAPDPLIPVEIVEEQKRLGSKDIKYGMDPRALLSTDELRNWQRLKSAYLRQYPELQIESAQAELDQLCDVLIMTERQRLKILNGQSVDIKERSSVGEDVQRLKKALGIHPDQLAKRVKPQTDTTIGSAAAKMEALGDIRQIRAKFFIEEMIQIYQMYNSISADGTTHQLDEVGLYGMTKCRTCACAKCGQRNFVGISIDEIEKWLISKNALVEMPE